MGLGPKWGDEPAVSYMASNPNPTNFNIKHIHQDRQLLVALVEYPNCTNFEGHKILVFDGLTELELRSLKVLDPHFAERRSPTNPIARFPPTFIGWDSALSFVEVINEHRCYTRIFPAGLKNV